MSIDDLAREHRLDIPGYSLINYKRMAFPFWHVNLKVLMLRELPFTIVEEYLMKMVDAGVITLTEISSILGLDQEVLTEAAVSLHQKDLIAIDQMHRVSLTKKGQKALPMLKTRNPETTGVSILIDGLTSSISSTGSRLLPPGELRKIGLPAVHTQVDRPTEKSISMTALREYMNRESSRGIPRGDLMDILRVEKAWVEYKPMSLLVFHNDESDRYRFNVYDKEHLVEEYESVLFSLEDERGVSVIPTEPPPKAVEQPIRITEISPEIIQEADRNRDARRMAESQVKAAVQENRDPQTIDELEHTLSSAESSTRTLETYEHRPLLLKTLSDARQRVIIVSPWLSPESMDDELFGLLEKALRRKVQIVIVHGLGDQSEAEELILGRLHAIRRKSFGTRLQLKRLGYTHQKILICDRKFVVIGSFNWLSFRGDQNRSLRLETSIYTENPQVVNDSIEGVEAIMATPDPSSVEKSLPASRPGD